MEEQLIMETEITKYITPNPIFYQENTYKSVVNLLDSIAAIPEKKKFEWEDGGLVEDTYNVTFNYDEWASLNDDLQEAIKNHLKGSLPADEDVAKVEPKNMDFSKVKDIVDGYILDTTGIYNGKVFQLEHKEIKSNDFNDVISFIQQLKETHETVLFYTALFRSLRYAESNESHSWMVKYKVFD
jgi:hypothetical protein